MIELNAAQLREMVVDAIAPTIALHRESRSTSQEEYEAPAGAVTDEEVDDFLVHNPLIDEETRDQLTDPGLLGFSANQARATDDWIEEFQHHLNQWAENNSWLAADLPWNTATSMLQPKRTDLWTPSISPQPGWLIESPSCLILAAELLKRGDLLSELGWREFENLIGELLESEGWSVTVTQATKDGGIDVVATKSDPTLGELKSVWQAKKYGGKSKVRLKEVRELSAVREEARATKGMIVTTSRLTRDAIEWVKRDIYRLGYKEHDHLKRWIEGVILGE